MKKMKWTESIFSTVDWMAHKSAFTRLTRFQQITTSKLIHNLANVNKQNQLYYKTDPRCPICLQVDEDFVNVLTCTDPRSTQNRQELLLQLEKDVTNIHTPKVVLQTILQVFHHWLNPITTQSRVPTVGSLAGPDILLTSAYHEQFHTLSWYQCCLGRISCKWRQAMVTYYNQAHQNMDAANWAPLFIVALWRFTKGAWQFRNQIVHGSDLEEAAEFALATLSEKVTTHYRAFKADPNYILPCHAPLFTQRLLQRLLILSYDYITFWLRSVEEARNILQLQDNHLCHTSRCFFSLFQLHPQHNTATSEDDSSYSDTLRSSHSTDTTLTLTSTASFTDLDHSFDSTDTTSTSAYMAFFPNDDTSSCKSTQLQSPSDNNSFCLTTATTPSDNRVLLNNSSPRHSSFDDDNPLSLTTDFSPNDATSNSILSN